MFNTVGNLKELVNFVPFLSGETNKKRRKSLILVECIEYENGGKF